MTSDVQIKSDQFMLRFRCSTDQCVMQPASMPTVYPNRLAKYKPCSLKTVHCNLIEIELSTMGTR